MREEMRGLGFAELILDIMADCLDIKGNDFMRLQGFWHNIIHTENRLLEPVFCVIIILLFVGGYP